METTTLYRPVNKVELDLIQKTQWKKFPPRLPEQPIFYPVTNQEYASQITTEWNLPSYKNGFVTEFRLSKKYLTKFKVEKVGLDHHTELWVPAEELEEFNNEIIGGIKVIEGYHADPDSQYVFVKNTFLANDRHVIELQFLNKEPKFEITKHSTIEDYGLEKYVNELKSAADSYENRDLETFMILMKDTFEMHPIKNNQVYLLKKNGRI